MYNKKFENNLCLADLKSKSGIEKKKKEMMDYLGESADFVIVSNTAHFNLIEFGQEVKKE